MKTKKFTFGATYMCYGTTTINVPADFTQWQAEQYVREHWDDIPLPTGDYVPDSHEPDFEHSKLEEE